MDKYFNAKFNSGSSIHRIERYVRPDGDITNIPICGVSSPRYYKYRFQAINSEVSCKKCLKLLKKHQTISSKTIFDS